MDTRDYPPEALREALLNAIVHRDYAFSSSTLISIFDDRIEIVSVGGLVRGMSYDDIMLGVSVLRNQHLANVFYRLQLIEAYGTGMLKIHECYADSSCKPLIEVTDNVFKITLPNVNYVHDSTPGNGISEKTPAQGKKQAVLKMFDHRDRITRKDVETALHISQSTAVLLIRDMLQEGLLVRNGNGRNAQYQRK